MLEKNLLFHTHGDVFPDSCNGNPNRLASGIEGLPDCFFSGSDTNPVNPDISADNPTSSERGAASRDNTYPHSRGNISQMNYDLSSCVNNWLAVENLDDVDKVLRNCDSTLELGSTCNDHELSWQSLSRAIEEPEDMWTSNFSFFHPESRPNKNNTVDYGPSKSNNRSTSANDSNKDSASMSSRSCILACEGGSSTTFDYSNFTNSPSHAISVTEEELMLSEPVDFSEELQCNQSDGKRKNQCVENFGLFHNNGSIRSVDTDLPFGNSSCQDFTSSDIQRQKNSTQFDPFGYFLNRVPQMQVDYSCSDQIQANPPSSELKLGSTVLTSFPPLETSYESNQVPFTGRSCGRSFEAPAECANDDKGSRERGFCPLYSSNSKYTNSHATSQDVQENSCMSTGYGEVSMEESQFCQLQQIVAQLDTGTKLSIRDGLFRLARSAEQRQKHAISDSCSIDDRDTGGTMITGGRNKHNGFPDMETDTNQIDRSIAHLLFHRP